MRTRTILSTLGVLALLAGCSADVADTGAPLRQVDVDAMTSQTLYVVSDSALPLTAADLVERGVAQEEAIPVRVEILDTTAVAWYAPAGEPVVSRDTIIALWQVVGRTEIANPTAGTDDQPTREPSYVVDLVSDLDYQPDFPGDDFEQVDTTTSAEAAILDFIDRLGSPEEIPMIAELGTYHPGCL